MDRVTCGQSWELGVVDSQEGLDSPENMRAEAGRSTAVGTLGLRTPLKHQVEPKLSMIQDC